MEEQGELFSPEETQDPRIVRATLEDQVDMTQGLCLQNIFQLIESYTRLKEEILSVRDDL